MANLRDLYQDLLLDHYRSPRNRYKLQNSNRQAEALNTLCGDEFRVYLFVESGIIRAISFDGSGCAISLASASMMTENLKGKSEEDARRIHDNFLHLLTAGLEPNADTAILGTLSIFSSVRQYPARVQCASLAWNAFRSALEGES